GTTQAARDAWFMGFTADYVAGVWMGYDDNAPLTGVTGGGLPAEIWQKTMEKVQEGLEPKPLPMIRPAAPPKVNPQFPGNTTSSNSRSGDKADNVLLDLLGSIFGGGNN
ncbi:MAG: glycosyl transferase, partial [Alphaproteobacteria bacterium]|nr:glycosyl transferase [Alphaproteobacteria bacterium]MBU1573710.1 glycosyl transferase [Alphaproteobacteria bacterium]